MIEIHNAIPETLQDFLEGSLNSIPWYYIDDVSFPNILPGDHYKQAGFNLTPFDNGAPTKDFDQFKWFFPLVRENYIKAYGAAARPVMPWRLRIGMNIPGPALYNNPHVDHAEDFKQRIRTNIVALYYVNSDEGSTYIFEETSKSTCYNVKHESKAEKGKLIFFDGNHYHASSPAKSSSNRVVFSLNLYEFFC